MNDSRALTRIELSPDRFPRTWETLRTGLTEGVAPGFVAGLWEARDPDRIHVASLGDRRRVPSPQPMRPDTIFDLASVSKVFATATLAAVLVDRRWIRWDLPLKAIFPDYPHGSILLSHLLSHTAGLPWWEPLWERMRSHFEMRPLEKTPVVERQRVMREMVFKIEPEGPPGVRAVYSDISFLLLGFALEEVTQLPLDQAVQRFVWDPIGARTAFYRRVTSGVNEARMDSVAATEDCPWRKGILQGQVHDDNCWSMGGFAGHAGAFGTVSDLLQFARRLDGGFLSRETLTQAWSRVSQPAGCERTLGWDTPSGTEPSASLSFSPRSVGHLGFTGTSLWIDPDAHLAVALLSNRVHPSRENILIRAFRPRFHAALRADLGR